MPVTFVKTVVAQVFTNTGSGASISVQASAAGNAIVVHAVCTSSTTPPNITTFDQSGTWSISQLTPIEHQNLTLNGVVVGTVAPDTNPTMITIAFETFDCSPLSFVGDELTGNDPTGGTTTFDAATQGLGSGGCGASVVTASDRETLWGACISSVPITDVGAGFTKASDDGNSHWSEYREAVGPSGTSVSTSFSNGLGGYLAAAVAIRPR